MSILEDITTPTYQGAARAEPSYPDDNPKTLQGDKKIPLHLAPMSAMHALAEGFADGAKKYGPYNWREKRVSSTVYYSAVLRHLAAWYDGEDIAEDSGVPHLSHAIACLAILIDAGSIGKLNDNRPPRGASGAIQAAWVNRTPRAYERKPDFLGRTIQPMDALVPAALQGYTTMLPPCPVAGCVAPSGHGSPLHTDACGQPFLWDTQERCQRLAGQSTAAEANRACAELVSLATRSGSSESGPTLPQCDPSPAQDRASSRDPLPTLQCDEYLPCDVGHPA